MPCTKCKSDFTLFNWKIKCGECEDKYCNKCLTRKEGILYCEVCIILIKRPPDRLRLMELKVKDLQEYLSKNNISTYGLVEKKELVDLLCVKNIPEKQRKGVDKLTANFGGVPSLKPMNEFISSLESVINDRQPRATARENGMTSQQANASQQTSPQSQAQSPPKRTRAPAPVPPTSPTRPSVPSAPSAPLAEDQPTTSQQSHQNHNSGAEVPKPPQVVDTPDGSPLPAAKHPKLTDFNSSEELRTLSSKQLKVLLAINRVDYRGCIEKIELLEKAQRLWEDSRQSKGLSEDAPIQELCKLCMDAPLDCVLLECGHITSCIDCGKRLAECPICRQYVVRVVRTFKA